MFKILAKNRTTGENVILVGYVSGGIYNKLAGETTPYPSLEFAKKHLDKNNWDFIKVVDNTQ